MLWVFPIAGESERTQELGEYKPFIKIQGKTILELHLTSIRSKIGKKDTLLFISTEEQEKKFVVKKNIGKILKTIGLNNQFYTHTNADHGQGPSETIYRAKEILLEFDEPLIIINPDQYVDFDLPEKIEEQTGYLPVYAEFTQKAGYVEIEDQKIIKIVEKNNISNLASAGIYIVSNPPDLIKAFENQFRTKLLTKNEFYIGPALNYLIGNGYDFYPLQVHIKYDLGNVESINYFKTLNSI